MNSKISFYNKSIIKSDFKRLWWICALHTVAVFLTSTLLFINRHFDSEVRYIENSLTMVGSQLFQYSFGFYFFSLIAPVVLGVMLFSYMQSGKASTFAHSLPVTRGCQYISHIISGLIMIVIPFVINAVILLLFGTSDDFSLAFKVSHLMSIIGESLLYSLVTFSAACAVSFISGNAVASFIFTYIFGLLPAMAEFFVNFFLETQLFGYMYNGNYSLTNLLYVQPGCFASWKNILLYLVIAVVFFAAGYLLYRIRNIENHSEVVAFPKLRPFFVYGVGICCGCLGFAYFYEMFDVKNALLLIPLGILGIVIAQMIVKKSFKVPEVYKPILGYSAFVLVLFVIFSFDLTGYERRIPVADNVQYVTFRSDTAPYYQDEFDDNNGQEYSVKQTFSPDIKDKATIEKVTALHKYLVQNQNSVYENPVAIYLTYHLDNGKTMNRWYYTDLTAQKNLLEDIIESDPVRQLYFEILRDCERNFESISIIDDRIAYYDYETLYPSDEMFNRLLDAMVKDFSNADYDEFANWYDSFTMIRISYSYPGVYKDGTEVPKTDLSQQTDSYYILPSFVNTVEILKEMGLYDSLPTAENVSTMTIGHDDMTMSDVGNDIETITDKDQIAQLLNYMNDNPAQINSNASVSVLLNDDYLYEWRFNTNDPDIPEFIK